MKVYNCEVVTKLELYMCRPITQLSPSSLIGMRKDGDGKPSLLGKGRKRNCTQRVHVCTIWCLLCGAVAAFAV